MSCSLATTNSLADPSLWVRAGRGRVFEFYATTDELQLWLNRYLPEPHGPYALVGSDLLRSGPRFEESPFACSISELVPCMSGAKRPRNVLFIQSASLSPSLENAPASDFRRWCSLNGLINVQHGFVDNNGQDVSVIGIVDQIRCIETGETRKHSRYLSIFNALKRALVKHLIYSTVRVGRDGESHESTSLRMSQGAVDAHRAGVAFRDQPGRLISR
jgi:hypothetical protein